MPYARALTVRSAKPPLHAPGLPLARLRQRACPDWLRDGGPLVSARLGRVVAGGGAAVS